jgi:hypothetical protein
VAPWRNAQRSPQGSSLYTLWALVVGAGASAAVAGITARAGLAGLLEPVGPTALSAVGVIGTAVAVGLVHARSAPKLATRSWYSPGLPLGISTVVLGLGLSILVHSSLTSSPPDFVALVLLLASLALSVTWLISPGQLEITEAAAVRNHAQRDPSRHPRYTASQEAVLMALTQTAAARDEETHEHAYLVADLSLRLASAIGMTPRHALDIYWAARLHDVGKVVVPRGLLKRAGPLKPEEFDLVKEHSDAGAEIISQASPELSDVALLVLHHHERWDGRGYPAQRRGLDIPLGSRIIAVADAFAALTEDRPYRRALSRGAAVEVIRAGAGTHFDPDIVTVFEGRIAEPVVAFEAEHAWPLLADGPVKTSEYRTLY